MAARPRRVLLDCDPGLDDAVAILLAAALEDIRLLGITTVAGNSSLENTTRNALMVCELAGLSDVPVAAGMERPLVRSRIEAERIHGVQGLGGIDLPPPKKRPVETHAVQFIIETLLRSEEKVTVVLIGPQTNLAMALLLEPRIADRIDEVVFMGGSTAGGNETPAAEFNICADAEAAHVVTHSGLPLTMIGLNVTTRFEIHRTQIETIRNIGTRSSQFVSEALTFLAQRYVNIRGVHHCILHDPCAVAVVHDRSLIRSRKMRVDVELRDEATYGKTVCADETHKAGSPGIDVAVDLDADKMFGLLCSGLAGLP